MPEVSKLTQVAGVPTPTRQTSTAEGVSMVIAGTPVGTSTGVTLALARVACFTLPAISALTVEVVDQVLTAATVLTWVPAALVHV